ncbi:IclR family transcriptional regulator [Salmonella enterica subsp. enterica]|uniref:IclR family transcriptional regulator n=1 Tax=Salmonella enterica subsp. enterica serovar Panama TaxID=29472 RepID=A0A619AF27_SALET|nr:IclR family transcriptional regulator [Salmonella enterica]EBA1164486.1 IclR family transcriptional regulator [Salmonella enterica subsp. enterica]EBF8622394.1 IclR family transcriptional regulator [Salmonella enterica subsp. enterica serovar Istanbul]EBS4563063.1 IclR family transcriptional regulator [Salmonella enterica subsp. enterica serovar Bovismorbificans]EBU7264668.1 IclR family transcriptional regulator [Salmonella enterica subsp. enterica serovar Oranienburg]ECD3767995.1 IclR fami
MMSENTNPSLRRGLRILKALKGKSLYGLSNKELAKALGESPVNITRSIEVLIAEGMVQRLETGRYAPGMQLLFIAQAFSNEMAIAQTRIAELNQRVLAGSHN